MITMAASSSSAQDKVRIDPVGLTCSDAQACARTDAVFFIHGIGGDATTFQHGGYDWPKEMARLFSPRAVDVYLVRYPTAMRTWLSRNVASFDDIASDMFDALYGRPGADGLSLTGGVLQQRPYRSMAMVAHSLGGNFAATLLQTVKSELGHSEHARFAGLVALGTPAHGAHLASVADVTLSVVQGLTGAGGVPLLASLRKDNTFLRMLTRWRHSTTQKSTRFGCRRVPLYIGLEGRFRNALRIVPPETALEPYRELAASHRHFPELDHMEIAKPATDADAVNVWVLSQLKDAFAKVDAWGNEPRCERLT